MNSEIIQGHFWLRAIFSVAIKQRIAASLLEQGLYPEHNRLQKEIAKGMKECDFLWQYCLEQKNDQLFRQLLGSTGKRKQQST